MKASLTLLSLLILTSACPGETNESAGSSTGGSSSGATTGDDTTGSTGSSTEPTSEPTTSGTSTGDDTTGSTTDASSTTEPTTEPTTDPTTGLTTGDPPIDVLPGCQALCDKLVACDLGRPGDGCAEFCTDEHTAKTPPCADASAAYLVCLEGLECDQILDAQFGESDHCIAERNTFGDVCGKHYDCGRVGSEGDGETCKLELKCDGEPVRELACDDVSCKCLVDGVEQGSCAAEAVCDDIDGLDEKGWACCGF